MKRFIGSAKILIIILLATFVLSYCFSKSSKYNYYSQTDNYVETSGVVSYIRYDNENSTLYISFTDLSYKFDDDTFKIVGDNYRLITEQNISLSIGDCVSFISAPRYYGDAYVMPIVSLSIDNEIILPFEDGYTNFLEWLREN